MLINQNLFWPFPIWFQAITLIPQQFIDKNIIKRKKNFNNISFIFLKFWLWVEYPWKRYAHKWLS